MHSLTVAIWAAYLLNLRQAHLLSRSRNTSPVIASLFCIVRHPALDDIGDLLIVMLKRHGVAVAV